MLKWTFICGVVFLTTVFELCQSRGVLTVRLLNFKNPKGRTYDGSCCDHVPRADGICPDQCDYVMRLIVAGLGRANDHVFLFHRPLKYDSNDISFGEDQSSEMVLTVLFDHWPDTGHVKMNVFFYDYDDFDHTTLLVDWFETELMRKVEKGDYDNAIVKGNRQQDKTILQFEWSITCYTKDECMHPPSDLKEWPWGLTSKVPNATTKGNTEMNKIESDWAKQWKKDTEKLSPYQPVVKSTIHKDNVIWGQGPVESSEEIHNENQKLNDFYETSFESKVTEMQSYPSQTTNSSHISNNVKHSRGMMPEIKRPFNSRADSKTTDRRNKNDSYERIMSGKKNISSKNKINGKHYKHKSEANKPVDNHKSKPPFSKQTNQDTADTRKSVIGLKKSPYPKSNEKNKTLKVKQEINRFGIGGKKTHNGTLHVQVPTGPPKRIVNKISVKTTKRKSGRNKINKQKENRQNKVKIEESLNSKSPFKRKTTKLTTSLPTTKKIKFGRSKTTPTSRLYETLPVTQVSTVNIKMLKPTTDSLVTKTRKEAWKQNTTKVVNANAKPRKPSNKSTKTIVSSSVSLTTGRVPTHQQTPAYQIPKKSYVTQKSPFGDAHNRLTTSATSFKSLTTGPPSRLKKIRKHPQIMKTKKENTTYNGQSIFEHNKAKSYVTDNTISKSVTKSHNVWENVKPEHKIKVNPKRNKRPTIPKHISEPSDINFKLHATRKMKNIPTTKIPFRKHTRGGMLKTMSDLIREQEEEAERLWKIQTTQRPHVDKLKTSLIGMADNAQRLTSPKQRMSANMLSQSTRTNRKEYNSQWSTTLSSFKPETSTNYVLSKQNNRNAKKDDILMSTSKPRISKKVLIKSKLNRNSNNNERKIDHKTNFLKTNKLPKEGSKMHVGSTATAHVNPTKLHPLHTTVKPTRTHKEQTPISKNQGVNEISKTMEKTANSNYETTTSSESKFTWLPTELKNSDVILIQTASPAVNHNVTTNQTTTTELPWWKWTTAPRYFSTSTKFGQWTQFTRWWQRPRTTLKYDTINTATSLPHTHIYTRRTTATAPLRHRTTATTKPAISNLPHTRAYTKRKTATNAFRHSIPTTNVPTSSSLRKTQMYTRKASDTNKFRRHTQTTKAPIRSTLSHTLRTTVVNPFRNHHHTTIIPLPVVTLRHSRTNTEVVRTKSRHHTLKTNHVPIVVKNKDISRKITKTKSYPITTITTGKTLKVTLIPKEITLQKQITNVTPKRQTSQSIRTFYKKTTALPSGKMKSRSKDVSTKLKSGNYNIKLQTYPTLTYSSKSSGLVTKAYTHSARLKPIGSLRDGIGPHTSTSIKLQEHILYKKVKEKPEAKVKTKLFENDGVKVEQSNKKLNKVFVGENADRKSDISPKKTKYVTTVLSTTAKHNIHSESITVKNSKHFIQKVSSTKSPIFNFDSKIFYKLNKSIKKKPVISTMVSDRPHSDNVQTFSPQIKPNIWKRNKKKKPLVLWNYVNENKHSSKSNNSSRWWLKTTVEHVLLASTIPPKRGPVFDLKALVAPYLKPNVTPQPVLKYSTNKTSIALDGQSHAKKTSTKHVTLSRDSNANKTTKWNIDGHTINRDERRMLTTTNLPRHRTIMKTFKHRTVQHLTTKFHVPSKRITTDHAAKQNVTPSVLPNTMHSKRPKGQWLRTTRLTSYWSGERPSSTRTPANADTNKQNTQRWIKPVPNLKLNKGNETKKKLLPWNRWLTTTNRIFVTGKFNPVQVDILAKKTKLTSVSPKQLIHITPLHMSSTDTVRARITKSPKSSIQKVLNRNSKHGGNKLKDKVDGIKLYSHKKGESAENKRSDKKTGHKKEAAEQSAKTNGERVTKSDIIHDRQIRRHSVASTLRYITENTTRKTKMLKIITNRIPNSRTFSTITVGSNLRNKVTVNKLSQPTAITEVKIKNKHVKTVKSILPITTRSSFTLPSDLTSKEKSLTTLSNIARRTRKKISLSMLTKTTLKPSTQKRSTFFETSQPSKDVRISKKNVVTKSMLKGQRTKISIPKTTKEFPVKRTTSIPKTTKVIHVKRKQTISITKTTKGIPVKRTKISITKTTKNPIKRKQTISIPKTTEKISVKHKQTIISIPKTTKKMSVKRKRTEIPKESTTTAKSTKKLATTTVRKLVKQTAATRSAKTTTRAVKTTRAIKTTTIRAKHSIRGSATREKNKVFQPKPKLGIRDFDLKHFLDFKIGTDHKNTKNKITTQMSTKLVGKMTTLTTKAVKKTTVAMKLKPTLVMEKVSKEPARPPPSMISNPSIRGPGVVVPDEGLFVPRFVFPDIGHNINRNISEGSVEVLIPSGSEARHVGLQVKRLNIKTVFNRYWPAILGLTIGTVFLVAAILTSVACRAQRLYVQRTRYLDAPQHLTEPPDTSEYSSSSAASLVSDRTRSSLRL